MERRHQETHFMKNLGLFGGLLLAAADTQGRPGLAWRASHYAGHSRHALEHGRHNLDHGLQTTRAQRPVTAPGGQDGPTRGEDRLPRRRGRAQVTELNQTVTT